MQQVSLAIALGVVLAAQAAATPKPAPPYPPCPPSCAAWSDKPRGCGIPTTLPNGTAGFVCRKALLFSAGFDSDMVLQRAPVTAAVYGQMVAAAPGAAASVVEGDIHRHVGGRGDLFSVVSTHQLPYE